MVPVHNIGQRTAECQHCHSLKWLGESPSMCCNSGKVLLPPLPQPPDTVSRLWQENTVRAKLFRRFARQINNCLALASQRVNDISGRLGGWTPSVVIQGRLFHMMGPLQAADQAPPTFAQIYVHDPDHEQEEAAIRLGK